MKKTGSLLREFSQTEPAQHMASVACLILIDQSWWVSVVVFGKYTRALLSVAGRPWWVLSSCRGAEIDQAPPCTAAFPATSMCSQQLLSAKVRDLVMESPRSVIPLVILKVIFFQLFFTY